MKKHHREVKKLAKEFGREVELRSGGHLALIDPTGQGRMVFTSSTPSCHRVLKNLRSELRKDS